MPKAELVSVCDVNEQAARQAKDRYQTATSYTDYRQMLERERLDAVAIATRTPQRAQILEDCARAGIRAVFCEKPLSNTLEEADRVSAALQASGTHFVYGARRRFMPAYLKAKAMIDAGEIGQLTTLVMKFGYGMLLWDHPHSIDIACFFAGDAPIRSVQADLELDPASVQGSVVDADPVVRLGYLAFDNGITAHIVSSDSFDVELCGTQGILAVRSDGWSVDVRRRAVDAGDDGWLMERVEVPVNFEEPSGTLRGIQQLLDAVLDGTPPSYTIQMAVRNQEALFGLLYSHLEGGRKISWPIERRGIRITGRVRDNLYA
jgi:predicted dehydrogenase